MSLRERLRSIRIGNGGGGRSVPVGVLAVAAGIAVLAWLTWTFRYYLLAVLSGNATIMGYPPTAFAFLVVAFGFGVAFIPLLAFVIGGALPGFISEPLANALAKVTMMRFKAAVLNQTETDEYQITGADGGLTPRSYWDRWAGTNFGLTFEATKEAFATTITDERRDMVENLAYVDEAEELPGFNRGDRPWHVTKDDREADILVPAGEKLSELRDAAGPEIAIEAYAEALKDYGGDTSEMSNKMMIIGSTLFTGMGLLMGYVVFF